jgi:hypothetical protein
MGDQERQRTTRIQLIWALPQGKKKNSTHTLSQNLPTRFETESESYYFLGLLICFIQKKDFICQASRAVAFVKVV